MRPKAMPPTAAATTLPVTFILELIINPYTPYKLISRGFGVRVII